jgi:hypothetical protein
LVVAVAVAVVVVEQVEFSSSQSLYPDLFR